MRKLINLFLFTIIMVMVSCADKMDSNLNQTGLYDQNGNLLTNTLVKTNTLHFTGDIPTWATNMNVNYVVTTNSDYTEIRYSDDILAPNLPDKPTDYYKIRVPFAGANEYYTVHYKDTNKLNQLWLDQINRRGESDGKVFALRNKANNRDLNNFQNLHKHGNYQARDYYYFNANGDIVWKEDDTIIKKFVGAIVTEYRDITERKFPEKKGGEDSASYQAIVRYKWEQKGIFTVGGIYANTLTTEYARKRYLNRKRGSEEWVKGDDPFKDGVFDFIAYRHVIETYSSTFTTAWAGNLFERQYTVPGFIEVLVMYDYDNMGYTGAAGLHSYYAYYGVYSFPTPYQESEGFKPWNMPYMTNQNIYLGERPEYTSPLLTHSAAFTDGERKPNWCFLFMPGHKN